MKLSTPVSLLPTYTVFGKRTTADKPAERHWGSSYSRHAARHVAIAPGRIRCPARGVFSDVGDKS